MLTHDSMSLRRAILAGTLLVSACPAFAETVTLTARPGYYNVQTIGDASPGGMVSGSVRMVAFNGTPSWPPGAYIGFYEGPDRSESVQFVVIRNHGEDSHLTAGYRVIENGQETKNEGLAEIPLDATLHVSLRIRDGSCYLTLNDSPEVTIRTRLKLVSPYVSVSSGSAEFTLDH